MTYSPPLRQVPARRAPSAAALVLSGIAHTGHCVACGGAGALQEGQKLAMLKDTVKEPPERAEYPCAALLYHAHLKVCTFSFMTREEELRAQMERDTQDPFWAHTLGIYLAGQGRWAEAEKAFQEALRRDPTHYATHYQLGLLYEQLGRESEAIDAFREGHRLAMEARDLRMVRDFRSKLALYLGMDEV